MSGKLFNEEEIRRCNMPVPLQKMRGNPLPAAPAPAVRKVWTTSKGPCRKAFKMGIYGEPGVGKSTLASLCPGVVFADIENSTLDLDVERANGIHNWPDLRSWVQSQNEGIRAIESMSQALVWATDHVIKTKKGNGGQSAQTSIEDWQYKIGESFILAEFRLLLSDIESSFRRGVSWIMTAHDSIERTTNTEGADFKQHQPDLFHTKNVDCREEWVRFCDHVAFIGRDVAVEKGKATGGFSRTIYMDGASSRCCKMRNLSEATMYWPEGGVHLWELLGVIKTEE